MRAALETQLLQPHLSESFSRSTNPKPGRKEAFEMTPPSCHLAEPGDCTAGSSQPQICEQNQRLLLIETAVLGGCVMHHRSPSHPREGIILSSRMCRVCRHLRRTQAQGWRYRVDLAIFPKPHPQDQYRLDLWAPLWAGTQKGPGFTVALG